MIEYRYERRFSVGFRWSLYFAVSHSFLVGVSLQANRLGSPLFKPGELMIAFYMGPFGASISRWLDE